MPFHIEDELLYVLMNRKCWSVVNASGQLRSKLNISDTSVESDSKYWIENFIS